MATAVTATAFRATADIATDVTATAFRVTADIATDVMATAAGATALMRTAVMEIFSCRDNCCGDSCHDNFSSDS